MNPAVLAITRHGVILAERVMACLPGATLYVPRKFASLAVQRIPAPVHPFDGRTGDQVPALFAGHDAIVAVVSLGAVVRLIAPHLGRKETDPAVVVLDEAGRFAIPVLSGHLGGANALAGRLAEALGAEAVLTTASDARQTLAVDLLGRELGWKLDGDHTTLVRASAAMVNDEPVALVQEAGSPHWWTGHANGRAGPLPANLSLFQCLEEVDAASFAAVLWVSHRPLPTGWADVPGGRCVVYRPPRVALGLGCDRGTPTATLTQCVQEALDRAGVALADVATVASIDLKSDEPGLAGLAAAHGWPLRFYPARTLAEVAVPNPSETVRRHTGTPSVAEAAALLAANAGVEALLVEKHRLRGPDGRHATVSVARMAEEGVLAGG